MTTPAERFLNSLAALRHGMRQIGMTGEHVVIEVSLDDYCVMLESSELGDLAGSNGDHLTVAGVTFISNPR